MPHARRPLALLAAAALLAGLLAVPAAARPPQVEPAVAQAVPDDPDPVLPTYRAQGSDLVRLMVGAFDPLAGPPPVAEGMAAVDAATVDPAASVYWLVQAEGSDLPGVVAAIESSGAEVAGFVPDGAYLMRGTSAQRLTVDASPAVRWTGMWQPGWKVPVAENGSQGLLDLAGPQDYRVYVFRAEPNPATVVRALRAIDGVEVVSDGGYAIDVRATSAQVPAIAGIPAVDWVELTPEFAPLNFNARWVNDTGVRDVYSATAPGRLSGAGQTAAVADTGINYAPDINGASQVFFRDCEDDGRCRLADYTSVVPGNSPGELAQVADNGSDHRKMAGYFDLGGVGVSPPDESTHGTHVAGSVNGDHATPGAYDGNDGLAPASRLVFQSVITPTGTLGGLPSDLYDLFAQAYRPSDPASVPREYDPADLDNYDAEEDARTHNNSYGAVIPNVDVSLIGGTGSAEAADRFVWEHEDMFIVASAGNRGSGAATMSAPSFAKNVVSSGASANGRQPMASIDSMASFSSHGPTTDGRFGVDLATPGQIVVGPKSGTDDAQQYLQGTSMSGPILTGLGTLVREYFWEGYGPAPAGDTASTSGIAVGDRDAARRHNPSAALVKAALVNGAERMRGFYTGTEGTRRELDGQYPSGGQGFGLVNLHNSLYFDDEQGKDTTSAWYHDVYRDDADAFGIGALLEQRDYQFDVAEGEPLDVTMAYTDAPTEPRQATPVTMNDLDLIVTAPDGTVYSGNNFNTELNPGTDEHATVPGLVHAGDPNNPVERVRVPEPQEGTWTVSVAGTRVVAAPAGFALAATGLLTEADGAAFTPGQPLQTDDPGAPKIEDVAVEPVSADLAKVTWTTDEPTTGAVVTTVDGEEATYVDSYNLGFDGYAGIDEGPVETSGDFAGRPMLGTSHEVLVSGLTHGETYDLRVTAADLGEATAEAVTSYTSTSAVFGAAPPDIGQLVESDNDQLPSFVIGASGWKTGTQLYTGNLGGPGVLGAFMFRTPESLDPARILGAAVELTSGHNTSSLYEDDVKLFVDLLPEELEEDWGTQDYTDIHEAESVSRTFAETNLREGGGRTYPFTFGCTDLAELRTHLDTVVDGTRNAPFRFDALTEAETSLFGAEFGFNRRSMGADLRPRLVLFMDDGSEQAIDPLPVDPDEPAPTISKLAVEPGIEEGSATVSWRTDVPSDSLVLYREPGDSEFIEVGSPARSSTHLLQVRGLDPETNYEFAVRSTVGNGASTTDDNGGEGYILPGDGVVKDDDGNPLGRDPVDENPDPTSAGGSAGLRAAPAAERSAAAAEERENLGGPYGYEDDAEGWSVTTGGNLVTSWTRGSPGQDSDTSFQITKENYLDLAETSLISPPVEHPGGAVFVSWQNTFDIEGGGFDEFHLEYRVDGGEWTTADEFGGQNSAFPEFGAEEVGFNAPAGMLEVRYRFFSDEVCSGPGTAGAEGLCARPEGYDGVKIDNVLIQQRAEPITEEAVAGQVFADDLLGAKRPQVGPQEPRSAEAAGFDAADVETRAIPTDAELAAGTGMCAPVARPLPDGDGDGDGSGDGDGPVDPPVVPPEGTVVDRVFGQGRIQTAVELSRRAFESADVAVLARADEFPDALTAATLAAEVEGPVLLTASDELSPEVAEELDRLGAERVYLAGGTQALGQEVEAGLADADVAAERLGGAERVATAALIAREVVDLGGPVEQAIVARADQFPDALAASNLATNGRAPIVLSGSEDLPDATVQVLEDLLGEGDAVFVAGGTAAVGQEPEGELSFAGYDVTRLGGAERYATAVLITEEAVRQGADLDPTLLASGVDFPDALAAGPAAHALGGSLLLVDPLDLADSAATRDYLTANAAEIGTLIVVGGINAVSAEVERQVTATLDG